LVAELFGEENVDANVVRPIPDPSNTEDFSDIALSGSCSPVDELISMQFSAEQGEDQCKYNTLSILLKMFFYLISNSIELCLI